MGEGEGTTHLSTRQQMVQVKELQFSGQNLFNLHSGDGAKSFQFAGLCICPTRARMGFGLEIMREILRMFTCVPSHAISLHISLHELSAK